MFKYFDYTIIAIARRGKQNKKFQKVHGSLYEKRNIIDFINFGSR